VLVHAGLNFILQDPFEDKHSMLWIREQKVLPAKIGYRRIVHGHTPIGLKKIREMIKKKNVPSIDIDNGCVYHGDDKGNLIALELNTLELMVQKNVEVPYVVNKPLAKLKK
jgi:serine/threonine protein phosphatase 1